MASPGDTGAVTSAEQPPSGSPRTLQVRRRPELSRFLIAGGLLGFVLGGLVGLLGPDAPASSRGQEVILLGATGAVFGAFLAAVVYLVLDRRSRRR